MGRSSKDRRDIFYRLAKEEGWRARSAFKLLHIETSFKIFKGVTRAVDLCAAPGSWSQVLAQQLRKNNTEINDARKSLQKIDINVGDGDDPLNSKPDTIATGTAGLGAVKANVTQAETTETFIVAVDLQTMSPIPGVICLKGDITEEKTAEEIIRCLGNSKAQLVVCDGAPDVTGLHQLDEFLQGQLLFSALSIATLILEEKGTFVAKIFRASRDGIETVYSRLQMFFEDVVITKPRSSRSSSIESFVVCRNFKLPPDFTPGYIRFNTSFSEDEIEDKDEEVDLKRRERGRMIIKFVACGDLNGFDSDTTYSVDTKANPSLPPTQSPITPAYEEAVRRRKERLLGLSEDEIVIKKGAENVSRQRPKTKPPKNKGPESIPAVEERGQKSQSARKIQLNFGGGAEKLVGDVRETVVDLPCSVDSEIKVYPMSGLLEWIKTNLIVERPELLIKDGNVRPGILVLVNDTDWELLGNVEYELEENDRVSFISTLHGG